MATTTFSPPPGLPTGRRIYACLVAPFGERVDDAHPDRGRVFGWGDLKLPRGDVPVDVDHDQQVVGYAASFVLTPSGVWCSLKVGDTGESLIQRGYTSVSAEIDDGGNIVAVSLVRSGSPGFASARVYDAQIGRRRAGAVVSDGVLVVGPGSRPAPAPAFRAPSMAMRDPAALLGPSPEAEVERLQRWWKTRVVELRETDVADEEGRLIAAGVPTPGWPATLPGRQRWEMLQAQQAAERAREVEARRLDQLELESSADRRAWPWWRRWLRRRR